MAEAAFPAVASSYSHWEEEWHHEPARDPSWPDGDYDDVDDDDAYARDFYRDHDNDQNLNAPIIARDGGDEQTMEERAPTPAAAAAIWPELPRDASAPSLFIHSVLSFALLFQRAVARHATRHGAAPDGEGTFLRPMRRAFRHIVGTSSGWLSSDRHKKAWQARMRAAKTIADFGGVIARLIHDLDTSGLFRREFYQMSSAYEGIDNTIVRYGY